jgi:superfamily I DNA/RNA helicase
VIDITDFLLDFKLLFAPLLFLVKLGACRMTQNTFEYQILNLLRIHAPIKAREIAKIFSSEFGKHVDRRDVNLVLHPLKREGKVKINDQGQWSPDNGYNVQSQSSTHQTTIIQNPSPIPQPTIQFTAEQQAIIDLDPTNHLLIRGQAGSGKTVVLAARAGKILSAMNKGSLLFLTYNSALCAYVKKAFAKAGMKGSIDVRTFHDWTRFAVKTLGADFKGWIDSGKREDQLKLCINETREDMGDHRLFDLDNNSYLISWWGDEIAWLFGQHITRLSEYLEVERKNRGTAIRVTRDDRLFIWSVYELYQEWLEESNQEDYDNPAGLLLRVLMESGQDFPDEMRYDHVMIDEVQDFDKSWLLAAIKVPRVSLSLAGDLAQKIYRRNFTWSSVGIQVQGGRSRRLNASHRTTAQIMAVAEYLLVGNDVTASDDYSEPVRPNKNGDKVKVISEGNTRDVYERGYQYVADNFKRMIKTSVIVALPFSKQLYPAQKALEKKGVQVKIARGAGLGNFDGGIAVTTYHQLKGLEFDHVVIMGLHDAQYPGRILDALPEEDRAEEANMMRRVLYVAMTRAKQSVTLVGSEPFCRFFNNVPDEMFEIL